MLQRNFDARTALLACAVGVLPFSAALAQQSNDEPIEEVVVRAHPLSAESIAQPVATLSGDEIERAIAPSIADTLHNLPGVTSASFGQAVGRPVIRGLGGARVKTMEDRIDSLDVSVSSPDHTTTIEPFTAKSIEVLKGPATLLYGTGAIGGVVDVHTGRIPHQVPDAVGGKIQLRTGDNADQRSAAGILEGGTGSFAFHVDAYYREADPYEIPGFAESAALRALEEEEEHDEEEEEEDGHEHEEEEEAFGVLPGSEMETRGGAVGLSYVGDRGFIGFSVSAYDSDYGLPGGHGHHEEEEEEEEEHEDEEGSPVLGLDQARFDIEAGLESPFGGFSRLNVRLGYNDYEHTETEASGEPGTVFANEAIEGRFELVHEGAGGFEGATGVQISNREFSAIGEEAFVQPVDTQTVGLFYVGRQQFGDSEFEFGARYERVEHDPSDGGSRHFSLAAASFGLIQPLSNEWTLSGQLDYSNRAPVAEELYSNGPHLATQSFEIGDRNLNEEQATNFSATLAYDNDRLSFLLSGYYTDFGDFIYEQATGAELDELPVLQWQQQDATFRGLEADVGWEVTTWEEGSLTLTAGFDMVRARLESGPNRNLPRIPPRRYRLGTILSWQNLLAEVTWTRADEQTDTAVGELPTGAYNDLRVHLGYAWNLGDRTLELFVAGRNLTDDEQRYHTSFIGQLAPQPGRTVEAGVTLRL